MGKLNINGGGVDTNKKMASIDERFGPYSSKEAADAALGGQGRNTITAGLTVGILTSNAGVKEYWYQPNKKSGVLELIPKDGKSGDTFPEGNFASFDANGNLQNSVCNEGTFIKGVQKNGTDLTPDADGKVNVEVQDGKSAYQLYVDEYEEAHGGSTEGMLEEDEWLDSLDAYGVYVKETTDNPIKTRGEWLDYIRGKSAREIYNQEKGTDYDDARFIEAIKANYPMKYVEYDENNYNATGITVISGITAGETTEGKLWFMPNDDNTETKLFITVNKGTAESPSYKWYNMGVVHIPSNPLTEEMVDNECNNGTVNTPASANVVMQLKAKLDGVTATETKGSTSIDYKGYIVCKTTGSSVAKTYKYDSVVHTVFIPIPQNTKKIRFLGRFAQNDTINSGYAFINAESPQVIQDNIIVSSVGSTNDISRYIVELHPWVNNGTANNTEILDVVIPDGATYFCAVYGTGSITQSNFYCYLQSGDNVVDTINRSIDAATQPIKDDIDRINEQMYVVVRSIPRGSAKNHYIDYNTNYWKNSGNNKHYNVEVNPGDIIKIEAQANYLARYAFLKEIPELDNNMTSDTILADYADDCTIEKIDAGGYVIVQVPTDAHCLYVLGGSASYSYPNKANLYLLRKLKDVVIENAKGTTIFDYNQDEYIKPRLAAATHPIRTEIELDNNEKTTVFNAGSVVFGHISDCHGYDRSGTETERRWNEFIDFCKHWKEKGFIDELVDTGDVLKANYNNNHNYIGWRTNAEDVLTIIGNHDTWNGNKNGWAAHAGRDVYDMLIENNVDNWGVVQPIDAESNGYCYYYKDYFKDNLKDNGFKDGDARKLESCLRAIYVDCMGFNETQYNWVKGLLNEALKGIVGEYTALNPFKGSVAVVIFTHFPPMTWRTIPCNYSARRSPGESVTPGKFNDYNIHFANLARAVYNFQLKDGIFAGYVCGHYHYDAIGKVVGGYKFTEYEEIEQTIYFNDDTYPQLVYAVSSGNVSFGVKLSDYKMEDACESQNSFQLISFDVAGKKTRLIKIGSRTDVYMRRKDTIAVTFNKYNDFDDSTDYDVNSRVMYENKLYRFIVRHDSKAWDYADVVEDNRILE